MAKMISLEEAYGTSTAVAPKRRLISLDEAYGTADNAHAFQPARAEEADLTNNAAGASKMMAMIRKAEGKPLESQPAPMIDTRSVAPGGAAVRGGTVRPLKQADEVPALEEGFTGAYQAGASALNHFLRTAETLLGGAAAFNAAERGRPSPVDPEKPLIPQAPMPEDTQSLGPWPRLVGGAAGAIAEMVPMGNVVSAPKLAKELSYALKFLRSIPSHAINSSYKFGTDTLLQGGTIDDAVKSASTGMAFGIAGANPATSAAGKIINSGVQAAAAKYITKLQGGSTEEQNLNAMIAAGMGLAEWMKDPSIDARLRNPTRSNAEALGIKSKAGAAQREQAFAEVREIRAKLAASEANTAERQAGMRVVDEIAGRDRGGNEPIGKPGTPRVEPVLPERMSQAERRSSLEEGMRQQGTIPDAIENLSKRIEGIPTPEQVRDAVGIPVEQGRQWLKRIWGEDVDVMRRAYGRMEQVGERVGQTVTEATQTAKKGFKRRGQEPVSSNQERVSEVGPERETVSSVREGDLQEGQAGPAAQAIAGGRAEPAPASTPQPEPAPVLRKKGFKKARGTSGTPRETAAEGPVPTDTPPNAVEGPQSRLAGNERPVTIGGIIDAAERNGVSLDTIRSAAKKKFFGASLSDLTPGELGSLATQMKLDIADYGRPSGPQRPLGPPMQNAGDPVTAGEIIRHAEDMTGAPIRIGKVLGKDRRGGLGVYKGSSHVIRTKVANDLDTAAHEVGHALHKRLLDMRSDFPPGVSKELSDLGSRLYGKDAPVTGMGPEGFAEYIARRAWGEDPQTFAPMTDNWFRNQVEAKAPADAAKLRQFSDMLKRWNAQGADARVEAAVSWTGQEKKGIRQRAQDVYHRIQRAWVDDKAAMVRVEKQAKEIAPLKVGESPSVMAKVLQNSEAAAAKDAIDRGVWSMKTNKIIAPGVREALQRLGPLDKETYRDWVKFLVARHGIEMWKKGKNPGISLDDAKTVYGMYENRPGFLSAANSLREFHRGLVDMYTEVGGLTKEAHDLILDSFSSYVPMKRLMDQGRPGAGGGSGSGSTTGKPVKRMSETGSGREVIDPVLATIQMAEDFYRAASMVRVKRAIHEMYAKRQGKLTSKGEGIGKWVEEVPAPTDSMETKLRDLAGQLKKANADLTSADLDAVLSITHQSEYYNGREPLISVMVDGKPKWYRLDPEYYTAVTNADPTKIDAFLGGTVVGKVLTGATRLKRLGATELRPSFGPYFNAIRDMITYPMRTEGWAAWAPLRVFNSFAHEASAGLKRIGGKDAVDPIAELFDRYGGQGSGFIGQDMQKAYRKGQEVLNSANHKEYKNIIRHPIDALRAALGALEKAPRLAETELLLKKHGYSRADLEAGKTPPPELVIEAVFGGMNVTTNFKAAGTMGRILNKVNAYANAKVQDTATDYRMMRDHPYRTAIRGMSMLTIPTVLYWASVHDEDWYKELPAWRKMAGWNVKIGDTPFLIPSPFLLGMVFSRLPEAMLNYAFDQDPKAMSDWANGVKQEYAPGIGTILPDAIEPIVEVAMDKDLFRDRPIVPQELKDRKPEDQYTRFTTSTSKYFGHLMGVSPAKLDHMIRGYVPLLTDVLQIPDSGPARALGLNRISRPMDKGRSVDDFYAERDRITAEYNSAKQRGPVDMKLTGQYARMNYYTDLMAEIRKSTGDSEKTNRYLTGLARSAMGMEELGEYPNPLTASNLPKDIKDARDRFIGRRLWQINDPKPVKTKTETSKEFSERKARYNNEVERAKTALEGLPMSQSKKKSFLKAEAKARGYKPDSEAMQERLKRVR